MRNGSTQESCMICGNEIFNKIGKPRISYGVKQFIDQEYMILQCEKCLFYFVSPSINFTDEVWGKLYGGTYFPEMTPWWERKRNRDRKERFARLEKNAAKPIKTFLDVGSGEGSFLIEASLKSWETHGVDISDNRISDAKGRDITFYQGDIFAAKYPNDYFDCVYMDSVLEHVPDPLVYLVEINRVMSGNGVLYVGVPNEDSLINGTKKIVNRVVNQQKYSSRIKPFISPYHVNGFTKKTLHVIAHLSNFEVLSLKNFGGEYDFLKYRYFTKPQNMQLALLPVHILAILLRKQTYLDAIFRKYTG